MKPIQIRVNFNSDDIIYNLFDKPNALKTQVTVRYFGNHLIINAKGTDYYGHVYTKSALLMPDPEDFVNFNVSEDDSDSTINGGDLVVIKDTNDAVAYFKVHKYGSDKILVIDTKGIYLLLPYDLADGEYKINVSPADVIFPIVPNNIKTTLPSNVEKLTDSDRFSFTLDNDNLYIYYNNDNIIDAVVGPNMPLQTINGVTSTTGYWDFSYNLNTTPAKPLSTIKGRTFPQVTAIPVNFNYDALPIYNYKQIPEGMTGIEKRKLVIENYAFDVNDLSRQLEATVYNIQTDGEEETATDIGELCGNTLSYDNLLTSRAFITYWPGVSKIDKDKWDALVTKYAMTTRNGDMSYNDMGIMEFITTNDITYDTYYPMYIDTQGEGGSDNPDNPDGQCVAAPSVEIQMSNLDNGVNFSGYWLAKGGSVNGGKIWVKCGDDTYKIYPKKPNSNIYVVSQSVVADGQEATGVLFEITTSSGNLENSTVSSGLVRPPSTWTVTAISDYSVCICSNNPTYGGLYVDDPDSEGATSDGLNKSLYYVRYPDADFVLHWRDFDIERKSESGDNKWYKVTLPVITKGDELYAYTEYDPETYDTLCAFDICSTDEGGEPIDPPCPDMDDGRSAEEIETCNNRETYIDSNGNLACQWVYDESTGGSSTCPPPPGDCECPAGEDNKYILNNDGTYSCICVPPEPPPPESSSVEGSSGEGSSGEDPSLPDPSLTSPGDDGGGGGDMGKPGDCQTIVREFTGVIIWVYPWDGYSQLLTYWQGFLCAQAKGTISLQFDSKPEWHTYEVNGKNLVAGYIADYGDGTINEYPGSFNGPVTLYTPNLYDELLDEDMTETMGHPIFKTITGIKVDKVSITIKGTLTSDHTGYTSDRYYAGPYVDEYSKCTYSCGSFGINTCESAIVTKTLALYTKPEKWYVGSCAQVYNGYTGASASWDTSECKVYTGDNYIAQWGEKCSAPDGTVSGNVEYRNCRGKDKIAKFKEVFNKASVEEKTWRTYSFSSLCSQTSTTYQTLDISWSGEVTNTDVGPTFGSY